MEAKLRNELADIRSALKRLSAKEAQLRQQLAELLSPFKAGDRISCKGGEDVFEIAEIRPGYNDKAPTYIACKIKKDGTPSKRKTVLYSHISRPLVLFQGE